jgi:hypothetical protein
MTSDEYCRLFEACLVMARQPDLPGVQARWLVMAEASLDLANIADKKRRHSRHLARVFLDATARPNRAAAARA